MLGALIKQGLVDSDEIVITSALECFIRLIKEFFNINIFLRSLIKYIFLKMIKDESNVKISCVRNRS